MAESEKQLVRVIGFHQTYERRPIKGDVLKDEIDERGFKIDAKGRRVTEIVEEDWVTYCPSHSPLGASTTERIRHIIPDQTSLNPESAEKSLFMTARWASIEPHYQAWKSGHEMPTSGTPLAQWPGVSAAMAEELKRYNLRTVEDVSELAEGMIERIRLPNVRGLREQAKAFLDNMKTNEVAAREVERDQEIEALKLALAEQRESLAAAMELLEEKASTNSANAERDALRRQLDEKHIQYHPNAGVKTLKALLVEAAEAA